MRIKMKQSMPVTVDGLNTVDAEKGDELSVGDGVGADLVKSGKADSLEPMFDESAQPKMVIQQKDAGDAAENKDAADETAPAKPKRSKRSKAK